MKKICVIFRYDDYSNWTSAEAERLIIELFTSYNVPCAFAVVPCSCAKGRRDISSKSPAPLAAEKANLLKALAKSNIIEVVQHGYAHQAIKKGMGSEFRGLSYDIQMQKISEGKKMLEDSLGVEISVFCPPWNSYDKTTLRVLSDLNFSCISGASRHGPVAEGVDIKYIPATCHVLGLQCAVERARSGKATTNIIVVMFHDYIFSEVYPGRGLLTIREFEKSLAWLVSQADVTISTFGDVCTVSGFDSKMFLDNRKVHRVKSLLPGRFWPSDALVSMSEVSVGTLIKVWAVVLIYCSVVAIISFIPTVMVGKLLLWKMKCLLPIMRYGGQLALIMFCLLYMKGGWFNTRRFCMGLSILIGMNIGILYWIFHA